MGELPDEAAGVPRRGSAPAEHEVNGDETSCVVCVVVKAGVMTTSAQPMSCVQRLGEVINPHIVGSLTMPKSGIKWV